MKKIIILVLVVLPLFLAACAMGSIVQSPQSTLVSPDSVSKAREVELLGEVNDLQAQLNELQTAVINLTEERDAAVREANSAVEDKNIAVNRANSYQSLFIYESGDVDGEYILCKDAFTTSFAYTDKVSMRKELIKYMADKKGLNPDFVSSEHQLTWSNASDGLLKITGGGYMYPFFVSFEDSDLGRYDYVFDLTYSCFLDFPKMENNYSRIQ